MRREDLIEKELTFLREELRDLKTCQVTFLTYATTATGLLLGITHLTDNTFIGAGYLFPLVILLPAWWVFFEKAKTITRIVGYYRVLENLILDPICPKKDFNFIGWENAQSKFREYEKKGKLKTWEDDKKAEEKNMNKIDSKINNNLIHRLKKFLQASPYWMLTYIIFLSLSSICWILSLSYYFVLGGSILPIIFAFPFIAASAGYKLINVRQLVWGRHSYDTNQYFWEKIFKDFSSLNNKTANVTRNS